MPSSIAEHCAGITAHLVALSLSPGSLIISNYFHLIMNLGEWLQKAAVTKQDSVAKAHHIPGPLTQDPWDPQPDCALKPTQA